MKSGNCSKAFISIRRSCYHHFIVAAVATAATAPSAMTDIQPSSR